MEGMKKPQAKLLFLAVIGALCMLALIGMMKKDPPQEIAPDPLIIEDDATIGHRATLHSCHIKRNALIGMDATVLDGAIIGEGAFIGAGSLVPPGKEIPDGMMAYGSPVRVVRPLTEAEKEDMQRIRSEYVEKGQYYRSLQK